MVATEDKLKAILPNAGKMLIRRVASQIKR